MTDKNPSASPASQDDGDYFRKRAADHLQLAEIAKESGSKAIHMRFHRIYRDRARMLGMVLRD
ncbi:hypothetical protein [Sphingomonas sp. Leaf343]|uniref:hypothetical protein n=1 Tax=Sphingomonas sp. Leaf343 TaxID=1736345 RepID=UPI0006FECC6B|nr:hypothetical protein [Sphingomonas sp. Leaf343]KQR82293.1 hypothetical protein ASG07_11605 [Sphingomonas sp. Leaf343]